MAADDVATLQQACNSMGVPLSGDESRRLLGYLELLRRWNQTYNLTAVRDPQAMLVQHLLDCLALVPALQNRLAGKARVLDVGSGGGLPGVVLAVMFPNAEVTCVDSVGKKVAFIRQVVGALGLRNLHPVHGRVETLNAGEFDLITARAFASLTDLVSLTQAHLAPSGCWMAMKGRLPSDEIASLPQRVEVFHVEPLQVPGLAAERCLIWMRPRAGVVEGKPAP